MMRSLFSGVSGVKGHQTRMDVIGNNIANVNTTGFKYSRTTFADMFSQTVGTASGPQGNSLGGVNPKQVGLGVGVASIDLMTTDGAVQSTGKNTDLCISGNALFGVKSGDEMYYTRDGAFEFDANGNYVLPGTGMFVQGWGMENQIKDSAGRVTGINTTSAAGNICIPANTSLGPVKSSIIGYTGNLDANVVAGTVVTKKVDDGSGGTTEETHAGLTSTNLGATTVATIYDALGNSYNVPVYFYKIGVNATGDTDPALAPTKAGSDWMAVIKSADLEKITPGIKIASGEETISYTQKYIDKDGNEQTALTPCWDADGNEVKGLKWFFHFDGDGSICKETGETTSTYTAIKDTDDPPYYELKPTFQLQNTDSSGAIVTEGDGATTQQTVSIRLNAGVVTQYASSGGSTIHYDTNDGYTYGTLSSVTIDNSGIITGVFSNSQRQQLGQIALYQFNNFAGLNKTGNSFYQPSNNSGEPQCGTVLSLGVTLTASALEMSNVDLAEQFSDMIITQRGFQSNSKIITVSDELLETLINMKR